VSKSSILWVSPFVLGGLGLAAALPGAALAQTNIGSGTTTIQTSTANGGSAGDVSINSDATRTANQNPALIVDSANTATNLGTLTRETTSEGSLVIVSSGLGRFFKSTGTINMTDDYSRTDTDNDGDLDGVFSTASNRTGILIGASGSLTTGGINVESGNLTVEGNASRGIHLAGAFQGDFLVGQTFGTGQAITMAGDRSIGIDIAGPIAGTVDIRSTINAQGEGAIALRMDGAITGALSITGTLTSYAYSFLDRGESERRDKLDADDLRQAGSAVIISKSVSGGVFLSGVGTEDDPDDDGDGIADDAETDEDTDDNRSSSLVSYGSAAAMQIIGATPGADQTTRLGSDTRFGFGLVTRGSIFGTGVYDNISALGLLIDGNVKIDNGHLNQGSISSVSYGANSTALMVRGADVGRLHNSGTINASLYEATDDEAIGVLVDANSSLRSLRNTGTISGAIVAGTGTAIGVRDRSGQLVEIINGGSISASLIESEEDADDVSGRAIALDLSQTTANIVYRQISNPTDTDDDGEDDLSDADPALAGEVLFGQGNDQFILEDGTVESTVSFGQGQDQLILTGGTFRGFLNDVDNSLSIDVRGGTLRTSAVEPQKVRAFSLGATGTWRLNVDLTTGQAGSMQVAGTARIDQGAMISPVLTGATRNAVTINLIQADRLEWIGTGATVGIESLPFLYRSSVSRSATSLDLTITPRSIDDLGLSKSEGTALDAVVALANVSTEISQAINSQLDGAAWRDAYRRLLPDYTDGKISTALAAARGVANAVRDLEIEDRAQNNFVWAQQFLFGEETDPASEQARQGQGFGLTTGIGSYLGPLDLVGLTASFTTGRYDRGASDADDAEIFALSSLSLGLVTLIREGGFRADLSASAGYDWTRSTRKVAIRGLDNDFESGIDETAKGKAKGWRATLAGEIGYTINHKGAFNLTPFANFEGVNLYEGGYTETDAPGLNLEVESLETLRLQARAGLDVSYRIGLPSDGWRFSLFGGAITTPVNQSNNRRARYVAAGDWFELEPFELQGDGTFGGLKIGYNGRSGSGSLNFETEKQGDRTKTSATLSLRLLY
jgi:Autotransporter beta-domain